MAPDRRKSAPPSGGCGSVVGAVFIIMVSLAWTGFLAWMIYELVTWLITK